MIPRDYVERLYAGFIGMNAGIRLGASVEPIEWTPEMIREVYGEVDGYLKDYDVFSADARFPPQLTQHGLVSLGFIKQKQNIVLS